MTGFHIGHIAHLRVRQAQQLPQLRAVCRRLIEKQQKFAVCQHEPRRLRFQALLHILCCSRQRCAVLSPTLPRAVEHLGRVFVLEIEIALVNEYPCEFASLAVGGDAVLDRLQCHDKRRGAQLLPHLIEIEGDNAAVHIDIAGVRKYIQTALCDQLSRQRDLPRFGINLPHDFIAPVRQERRGPLAAAFKIGTVNIGCAAVNDGLMRTRECSCTHLLF